MAEVFVSYRRADAPLVTALLTEKLTSAFGRECVFRDADDLIPGRPWAEGLTEALAASSVLVAVIGPAWMDAPAQDDSGSGGALDRPDDWVRREIVTAFDRNIPVVPVLLDETPRPPADRLPEDLQPLTRIEDMRIRHRDLRGDLDRLLDTLVTHVPSLATRKAVSAARSPKVLLTVPQYLRSYALPGSDSPLMGRARTLTDLRAHLASRSSGLRAPVVIIDGDAGIGKTRMALDVSAGFAGSLVVPAGVGVGPRDLSDVAADRPVVLVVDDAHRSPDLSGVAALLRDARFDEVRVVLTARRGFAEEISGRIGTRHRDVHRLTLDILDRASIDALVRGHGIEHEPFRLHVGNAAEGNPLIAHTACQIVKRSGHYTVTDTANILVDFVESRLLLTDRPGDPRQADVRRAVLTAVALYAGASSADRAGLCRLAPAITALPPQPHEIDSAIADLLEAGLIVDAGRTGQRGAVAFVVRPDAAGPVVVHGALHSGGRVRLNAHEALPILGAAATFGSFEAASAGACPRGILGLPAPLLNGTCGLDLDTGQLAAQLHVLTQTAHLGSDDALGTLLGRAVHELLPPDADSWAWSDVLTLAGQVASISPTLPVELHRSLIAQWPPAPGTDLFGDTTPEVHCHRGIERLVRGVAEQVGHLRGLPPDIVVGWLLDTAWLAYPALGTLVAEPVRTAVTAFGTSRHTSTAETAEHLLDRRRTMVATIEQWWTQRAQQEPDNLAESERHLRSADVATRVALPALEPFLSVLTSETTVSPQDADLYWWRHYVLPDHADAADTLSRTLGLVIAMLDRLTSTDRTSAGSEPADGASIDALLWIADRPYRMLGEAARGLDSGCPLPDYAADLLRDGADRLRHAVADRWDRLPMRVRHTVAVVATRRAGRSAGASSTHPTLAQAAAAGEPVAERALADPELLKVATIFPIDSIPVSEIGDESPTTRARGAAAARLGRDLDLTAAIALLDGIGPPHPTGWPDYLDDFAHAVGSRVADPAPLLQRLDEGPVLGGEALLSAAATTCADAVRRWLVDGLGASERIARLTVAVADALPSDAESELLDMLCAAYFARTGPAASPTDAQDRPEDVGLLAQMLALHLGNCRQSASERLRRLHLLGETVPITGLEWVLHAIASVLRSTDQLVGIVSDDTELTTGLVRLLDRASHVGEDDDPTSALPYVQAELEATLRAVLPDNDRLSHRGTPSSDG